MFDGGIIVLRFAFMMMAMVGTYMRMSCIFPVTWMTL